MSLAIRAAARLLPAGIRDRYREQWLADARDAPEAGIRPSSIALAALAFAVTYDRPLPAPRVPTAEQRAQRSRLAVGLALSAALLSVSQFANLSGSAGLLGVVAYDLALELLNSMLFLFALVATVSAAVIAVRSRAMGARVRIAVALLLLAALAPIAHMVIDSYPVVNDEVYFAFGGVAYLGGAILIVVAARLLWTSGDRRPRPARPKWGSIALAALVTLIAGGLGFRHVLVMWVSRTPMRWIWEPAVASTLAEDGTIVSWEIPVTQGDYERWLALGQLFETLITAALAAFAAAVLVCLAGVVVGAVQARISPAVLATASLATLLVCHAALASFVGSSVASTMPATDLTLAIGRVALVVLALVTVGGVRYLPRVRHRHDVESGVELL